MINDTLVYQEHLDELHNIIYLSQFTKGIHILFFPDGLNHFKIYFIYLFLKDKKF